MAQLTYNSIKKFRSYERDREEEERLQEETLRDKLLKQIVSHHLKRDVKMEVCLKNKDKFVVSAKQDGFSGFKKGLMSSESFKNTCQDVDVKEVLSSCGLEPSEIDVLLNEKFGLGTGTEDALRQRLSYMEQKLILRQKVLEETSLPRFPSAVKLSRHEYEEECSKAASIEAEKLTSCLIQLEPYVDPALPLDHPMNKLSDLEKQLFPAQEPGSQANKNKKRKLNMDDKAPPVFFVNKKPNSLWDLKERPVLVLDSYAPIVKERNENPFQFLNETSASRPDCSKSFVWTLRSSDLVSLSVIRDNRQTYEEIRSNSVFRNYFPGIPSSTLFIKNLPKKLDPLSLVALFGNFEEENESKLEYRILKGKMKGQAFVRFENAQVAAKALGHCNGYVLDGKPLVIEYGKSGK